MLSSGAMDPFVRRLVERLCDPSAPLSRNRHFQTFETPEGKAAMRIFRRLRGLRQDLLTCVREGGQASCTLTGPEGERRMELTLTRIKGQRISMIDEAEWELLLRLPGVAEALALPGSDGPPGGAAPQAT